MLGGWISGGGYGGRSLTRLDVSDDHLGKKASHCNLRGVRMLGYISGEIKGYRSTRGASVGKVHSSYRLGDLRGRRSLRGVGGWVGARMLATTANITAYQI